MRLFFRVAAGLAISAFLAMLLLLAVLLVAPRAMPLELSRAGKAAALAASLVLIFIVVFLSPCLSRPVSLKCKEGLTQEPPAQPAKDGSGSRAKAAAAPASEACPPADISAGFVARAVQQAVVSLVPEAARAASAAAEHSGCYVRPISGGFEGLVPKESEGGAHARPDPVTTRDGVFVIDADAALSMEDDAEIDRDFKSLVDSVLA